MEGFQEERLKLEIETTEEWVEQRQAMGDDPDAFIALTKKYVDVTDLTQTIVNEYIKKIIIHAPDKSDGKRRQDVMPIRHYSPLIKRFLSLGVTSFLSRAALVISMASVQNS